MKFSMVETGAVFLQQGRALTKTTETEAVDPVTKEQVVLSPKADVDYVKVIKEIDDAYALRVSLGGTDNIGFYCVYRGDKAKIVSMMKRVLAALECRHVPVEQSELN